MGRPGATFIRSEPRRAGVQSGPPRVHAPSAAPAGPAPLGQFYLDRRRLAIVPTYQHQLGDILRRPQICFNLTESRDLVTRPRNVTRSTGVRGLTLASDFVRRTAASNSTARPGKRPTSAPSGNSAGKLSAGQAARCTEPSCHHDHTSSVT